MHNIKKLHENTMATLLEDIKSQSDWVVKAFASDNLKLDHSLESLKTVDNFMDLHAERGKAKPGGRLSTNLGPILFSIGSYLGETLIHNIPGATWKTNDNDPQGEVNAEIRLPDGTTIWPIQRVIRRFHNGPEDAIYPYGAVIIKEISKGDYWAKHKAPDPTRKIQGLPKPKKSWWKFW
jgi:hypothetical protein